MGMKPRLDDHTKHIIIDSKLVTCQNHASGEESNPNIVNTVTTHKTEENKKLAPNIVSGPKKG